MCASVRVYVCIRVNEGGRANISCQREKRRVKSDERKTGGKQSERGGEQWEIETNIVSERRGIDAMERNRKCLNDKRGIRKTGREDER